MACIRIGMLWVFLISVLGNQMLECQVWMHKAERREKAYLHRVEAEKGETLWVPSSEYPLVEKGSEIWVNGKLYDVFHAEKEGEGFRVKAIRDELETWALRSFLRSQKGPHPLQDKVQIVSLNPTWWDQVSVSPVPAPSGQSVAYPDFSFKAMFLKDGPSSPPPKQV
jgi:hypothetical protein